MHSAAVLRLTGTERAVAEVAAVAEHVASLTTVAAAFQLRADVPSSPGTGDGGALVALLDEHSAHHVPAIWRALAHQPRLLDATWRKDRLILSAGRIDEFVKACVALAVAQFRQSEYWIPYFTHLLRRRSGLEDRVLVELAGAVMHYVSFNTIAHGMRLHAPVDDLTATDVAAGGPLEHIVPGVRRMK